MADGSLLLYYENGKTDEKEDAKNLGLSNLEEWNYH